MKDAFVVLWEICKTLALLYLLVGAFTYMIRVVYR